MSDFTFVPEHERRSVAYQRCADIATTSTRNKDLTIELHGRCSMCFRIQEESPRCSTQMCLSQRQSEERPVRQQKLVGELRDDTVRRVERISRLVSQAVRHEPAWVKVDVARDGSRDNKLNRASMLCGENHLFPMP